MPWPTDPGLPRPDVASWEISHGTTSNIVCSGTITTVGVHGTDRVMLQLAGMNTIVQICNLGATVGTTYPNVAEQCKAQYATLLTAYALGKSMSVYFDDVVTGTSCTNFAPWELAVIRWVHLDNGGHQREL